MPLPSSFILRAISLASIVRASEAAISNSSAPFQWGSVVPTKDLRYHDCFGQYKCARLEVPLNWLNETDKRTVAIAVIKLPAVVPDDEPTFGGSIITNPGGPADSGVDFLLNTGLDLQKILDKSGHRHYEILSFDPRGISNTTPMIDCFHSNHLSRAATQMETHGNGGLSQGYETIKYGLAMTEGLSLRCKETEEQYGEILSYVNTPSVARDMVEMVDKIDELRKQEQAQKRKNGKLRVRARAEKDKDVPRLQYIGQSYGTILGNYFASMYPGRVERMILDGVTDAVDWTHGPGWLTSIVDTDETFDRFWDGCHQVGPSICALARSSDASSAEPKARFWLWVESLDEKPRSTIRASTGAIVTFSGYDVRSVVGKALTDPHYYFISTAEAVDQAMSGNDTLLVERMVHVGQIASLQDIYPEGGPFAVPTPIRESPSSVYCSDGEDISGKDIAWWQEYIDYQIGLSKLYGSFWASVRFACSSWPFRPNWEFRGPFTSPPPNPNRIPGVPTAPLLFLSNRLDPVTPLRSARAMAAGHPGAAVVIQEALGHCVLGTAPSKCVWKIAADYFDSGVVPDKETVCQVDCGPWDASCNPY